MKNNNKLSNKGNVEFFCNCYACRDSGYQYKDDGLFLEENSSKIYQMFGKELVK